MKAKEQTSTETDVKTTSELQTLTGGDVGTLTAGSLVGDGLTAISISAGTITGENLTGYITTAANIVVTHPSIKLLDELENEINNLGGFAVSQLQPLVVKIRNTLL